MMDHDGWYNPWDELKKPEMKERYDRCVASGGYVFRTGAVHITPGRVYIDETNTLRSTPATYMHYGDGLHFVTFGAAKDPAQRRNP